MTDDGYAVQNEYFSAAKELQSLWEKLVAREISQEEFCAGCKRLARATQACEQRFRECEKKEVKL